MEKHHIFLARSLVQFVQHHTAATNAKMDIIYKDICANHVHKSV